MVSSTHPNNHHYAIDAAKLVEKCRSLLNSILNVIESNSSERAFQRRAFQLLSMCDGKWMYLDNSIYSRYYVDIIRGWEKYSYSYVHILPMILCLTHVFAFVYKYESALKCVDRLIHTHCKYCSVSILCCFLFVFIYKNLPNYSS